MVVGVSVHGPLGGAAGHGSRTICATVIALGEAADILKTIAEERSAVDPAFAASRLWRSGSSAENKCRWRRNDL
jgi:hypothetical protein